MSEWIKWYGGKCPVNEGALVDVRYRDGMGMLRVPALVDLRDNMRDAGIEYWNNDSVGNDIVAYRLSTQEEAYEETERPIDSALNVQVDGNHYKHFQIQPVEYINANEMDFLQGSVVKYISRHKMKGRQKDVEKAIHFCKLILELQYVEVK